MSTSKNTDFMASSRNVEKCKSERKESINTLYLEFESSELSTEEFSVDEDIGALKFSEL